MHPRNISRFLAWHRPAKSFVALTLFAAATSSVAFSQAPIAPSAMKQIDEIVAIKRSLSPAEQKLAFNLVLLERDAKGKLPADLKSLADRTNLDATGNVGVQVDGYLTPSLLSSDEMRGVDKVNGQVPASAFTGGKVRAHVALAKLLALAARSDVKAISDVERHSTNVGSLTSQAYVSHGANKVVPTGINGTGIRVGVLSDSASPTRVQALIASGDLPSDVVVLPGQAGSGEDEGTAMMEIVHDLAPGAKLFFATADPTQAQFAANIRSLRYDYGCDIIVDDISYFAEAAFQDGTVAQAVNDVTANGALYLSAAANSGNLTSGTSGTWEGDFNAGPTGTGTLAGAGTLHNFALSGAPAYYDTLTAGSTFISLKWSDPLGKSANDYDLYVLNSTGTTVLGIGGATQNGTQDPFEYASSNNGFPAGARVVVALYSGQQRALRVDTNRGQLSIGTAGSTYGHNAAASTYTLAATYWNSAHTGTKPFTGAANPIETFSSDGPRKIFYNPDGSAITPGNLLFSTGGGTTLQKPDATAADGVTTRTPGFNPFYGTSAAAPHAAAIAALVKSANPSLTNVQIRNILNATALDNMAAGADRDGGYGVLWAPAAVALATAGNQ